MTMSRKILLFIFTCCLIQSATHAQVVASQKSTEKNSQAASGLLPLPQRMKFTGKKFSIDKNWKVLANASPEQAQALTSLQQGLKEAKLTVNLIGNKTQAGKSPSIQLIVKSGSVDIGTSVDTNRVALAAQAYHLSLKPGSITITANAPQGLYFVNSHNFRKVR